MVHGLCLLASALIGYFVLLQRLKLNHLIENAIEDNHLVILMPIASLCVIITLNTLFGGSGLDDNPFCRIALIATCCFAIVLQYSELKRNHLSVENRIIQQMLNAERSQYYISKETIDILNTKHHDLKHQINAIRSLCQAEQSAALREVENAIDVYNIVAKTGNEALDAVLTEKMLFCERHNVLMTYMVDQASLSFINILDLYSLFGNILDNAIENVMKEDEDKRVITLQICQKNGFLSIHLENYCKEPPEFRNGLPQTTKRDKQNHGFGVKSVRYLVQRYQEHTVFQAEHEMFLLDILIPIPNEARSAQEV